MPASLFVSSLHLKPETHNRHAEVIDSAYRPAVTYRPFKNQDCQRRRNDNRGYRPK